MSNDGSYDNASKLSCWIDPADWLQKIAAGTGVDGKVYLALEKIREIVTAERKAAAQARRRAEAEAMFDAKAVPAK